MKELATTTESVVTRQALNPYLAINFSSPG
jgi:hypothetical protein